MKNALYILGGFLAGGGIFWYLQKQKTEDQSPEDTAEEIPETGSKNSGNGSSTSNEPQTKITAGMRLNVVASAAKAVNIRLAAGTKGEIAGKISTTTYFGIATGVVKKLDGYNWVQMRIDPKMKYSAIMQKTFPIGKSYYVIEQATKDVTQLRDKVVEAGGIFL